MNTFYIIPSYKDAMHHGVLGMKWGIRRYQPYSVVPRGSGEGGKEIGEAANYGKDDIKAAKKNVRTAYKELKSTYRKKEKYENKILEGSEIPNKKEVKYKDAINRYNIAMNQLNDADLILGSDGFKKALKNAVQGTSVTPKILLGGLAIGLPAAMLSDTPVINRILDNMDKKATRDKMLDQMSKEGLKKQSTTDFEKNKIKEALNNPKGYSDSFIKNVTKGLNDSQKKSMNNAIQNDKWNLDFLESIQNSKIFNDDNTEAMAKEYNKFLKDPEYYMTEGAYKLKRA